jgi:hypothetical protein
MHDRDALIINATAGDSPYPRDEQRAEFSGGHVERDLDEHEGVARRETLAFGFKLKKRAHTLGEARTRGYGVCLREGDKWVDGRREHGDGDRDRDRSGAGVARYREDVLQDLIGLLRRLST